MPPHIPLQRDTSRAGRIYDAACSIFRSGLKSVGPDQLLYGKALTRQPVKDSLVDGIIH